MAKTAKKLATSHKKAISKGLKQHHATKTGPSKAEKAWLKRINGVAISATEAKHAAKQDAIHAKRSLKLERKAMQAGKAFIKALAAGSKR